MATVCLLPEGCQDAGPAENAASSVTAAFRTVRNAGVMAWCVLATRSLSPGLQVWLEEDL